MPATVKGGLFAQYGTTLSTIHTRTAIKRRIAALFGRRQMLATREVLETLNGATAGAAALKQLTRIVAAVELGGVRAKETVDLVNRATLSADVTDINADLLTYNSYDSTPVPNLDGNAALMGISH